MAARQAGHERRSAYLWQHRPVNRHLQSVLMRQSTGQSPCLDVIWQQDER